MKVFDDVTDIAQQTFTALNGKCPHCGSDLESMHRHQDRPRYPRKFQCPTCHTRMEITTRNNERMMWAFICAFYVFGIALVLGQVLF